MTNITWKDRINYIATPHPNVQYTHEKGAERFLIIYFFVF